jgi:gamma-glutamyltranspeptidase/glutathione hydrolase
MTKIFADDDRSQGRSMTLARKGIVAAEQPLAAQAGVTILSQGGNAIDAAVAVNATMGVVSPMMCGIGGDLFALVYEAKTGKLHGLNASGWAAQGLTASVLKAQGATSMPQTGIQTITVPGAVEGWHQLLKRFGRKNFQEVLAPAIRYAKEGFPVSELVADYWKSSEATLKKSASSARTFLPGGHAPGLGDIFRNPDLARSYEEISSRGRDGYYSGTIADRIVEWSAKNGGKLNRQDFREFTAEWVEPISTTYRGWTVYEIPPNGQGVAALAMLNLMERFELGKTGPGSPEALHIMIEAKKLAYADMARHVGDPKFSKVPVKEILSKSYAEKRAAMIDREHAHCSAEAGVTMRTGTDTTYLCVVDEDGNMVSLIQSNYQAFGTGLVAEDTGFALQNRGALFTLEEGHPNMLAGRKRPLHTIIPAFMERGDTRIAFGIMGGWNQSQAHAQFVANVVDFQMNIQQAIEAPRFTKLTFEGCDVQMESRFALETRSNLQARGHQIQLCGPFTQSVGGGQAVLRNFASGVNFGASDPRKDGAAIPQP